MNAAVFAAGKLWSAVNTVVKTPNGPTRVGIAWFGIAPSVALQPKPRASSTSLIAAGGLGLATLLAMRDAVMSLNPLPDLVLVDAFRIPDLPMAQRGIVHGDARCSAIAAASIVAKVVRDRHMAELHLADPRYGFDRHKGYATADHLAAVARFGYSPVHRRSFRPPSLFDTMEGLADAGLAVSGAGEADDFVR